MAQNIRVSIDIIEVIKDGDPSGEGEIYWLFRADNSTIDSRSVNSFLKVSSGENIEIGEEITVSKNPGELLVIYGSVSDKDGGFDGADETDSFQIYARDTNNWSAGPIRERLTKGALDVVVHGRIDLV
jgi:hypothetical protein